MFLRLQLVDENVGPLGRSELVDVGCRRHAAPRLIHFVRTESEIGGNFRIELLHPPISSGCEQVVSAEEALS